MESGSIWRIPHLLTDPSSLGPETPASPQLLVHPQKVSDFSRAMAPHHLRRVCRYLARGKFSAALLTSVSCSSSPAVIRTEVSQAELRAAGHVVSTQSPIADFVCNLESRAEAGEPCRDCSMRECSGGRLKCYCSTPSCSTLLIRLPLPIINLERRRIR